MIEQHALQAWLKRDMEFEEAFESELDVPNMRKLFGKRTEVTLNAYRDHLLAGHLIGALPIQKSTVIPAQLEKLAALDHDKEVATFREGSLTTLTTRRAIYKIAMDVQAGKIQLFE